MSDSNDEPTREYRLPDGTSYTFSGRMTDVRMRMLACEILTKLGCDYHIGNPKMDPIDYFAVDMLLALKADVHDMQEVRNLLDGVEGDKNEIRRMTDLLDGRLHFSSLTIARAQGKA